MKSSRCSSMKMERKDVEKNRRLHMKGLCLKLSSLIPHHFHASPNSKDTQLDHLDKAAAYIKQLKERIEELKQQQEEEGLEQRHPGAAAAPAADAASAATVSMPVIEVRYHEATLDVVLVSKLSRPFKLHEVITVLEQEGAEVVSASFSAVGDKIFYTIHSQALCSRIGLEASRVSERLQQLV